MSEHMNIDEGNSGMSITGDLIDRAGWVQGSMGDGSSGYGEHGAIMACTPRRGDAYLVRAVMRRRGYDEVWNDREGRTAGEVTDAELADTFGPQWREVVSLVRRAAALTEAEVAALESARRAAGGVSWDAAVDVAVDTAWEAAWDAAWDTAVDAAGRAAGDAATEAAWDAAWDAAGRAAWDAAGRAAWALVVRDLVGRSGFEQEHYDVLTKPWASVIGKVHPDDAPLPPALGEEKTT